LAVIGFGIFGMDQWLDTATQVTAAAEWHIWFTSGYALERNMLLIGAFLNVLAMVAMVVISYIKPWGKRKPLKERSAVRRRAAASEG
jgi:hypothetical protein